MKKGSIENFIGKFSKKNFEVISLGNLGKSKFSIILASFIFVMFLTSFISASIFFSDLDSKYNLGDVVVLDVSVDPIEPGYLVNVQLICGDDLVIPFNRFPDDAGHVKIELPLNFNTINNANGNCYFSGQYGVNSVRKSVNFEISKLLIVRLGNDALFVNPGEQIVVSGSAERLNGNFVNGEVEIRIPLLEVKKIFEDEVVEVIEEEVVEDEEVTEDTESDNSEEDTEETLDSNRAEEDTEEEIEEEEIEEEEIEEEEIEAVDSVDFDAGIFYGKVIGGDFSVTVSIPENAPAGDYRIDALVYEESNGQRSSEGVSYANLKVFQVLQNVELTLNNQNFDPGMVMEIRPGLLDQTGVNINDEVSVIIRGESGERFYEKIVQSKEGLNYLIPNDFASGYYEVVASNGNEEVVKSLFINRKASVKFEIVENNVVVTNDGNIPYNKGVEFELNGKPFVKIVDLELGESTTFKLTGEDGDYNVRISDGNSELVQSGVSLTGRVIDVSQIGASINLGGPIFWIFLFVILILILFFIFRKVLKKKSFAFHLPKMKKKDSVASSNSLTPIAASKVSVPIQNHTTSAVAGSAAVDPLVKKTDSSGKVIHNQADQVLVLKGHKARAAILVIKIKNKLEENEKKSLEVAMEHVYAKKGAVYEQGDFIFAIFSPLMTKVDNNEALAAGVGSGIINVLNEHNKKFKNKIDFGIAINSGEIINKIEQGKLKFTALGNFVVAAKRLAESSNKQVLLSKESFSRAGSEIKAEKISDGEAYDLRRIVDSEKNNKFIQGFLERQKKG